MFYSLLLSLWRDGCSQRSDAAPHKVREKLSLWILWRPVGRGINHRGPAGLCVLTEQPCQQRSPETGAICLSLAQTWNVALSNERSLLPCADYIWSYTKQRFYRVTNCPWTLLLSASPVSHCSLLPRLLSACRPLPSAQLYSATCCSTVSSWSGPWIFWAV